MLTPLGPFSRDTEKKRIEVVSVTVMDLKTHARRELPDRIKPFFVFQIGMDIRIVEISRGIESFFLQPEIRIECAGSTADME
jgi:hypothetical protein